MTTRDDMPDDPLAGVDLQAWQPPAPPAAQVDSILARLRDGTRTDVASAVEVDRDDVPAKVDRSRAFPPRRSRWLATGIIIGAAAAVLIVLAIQAGGDDAPTRTVGVPTDHGDRAGGTLAGDLVTCQQHRDDHSWIALMKCAKGVLARDPGNPDAQELLAVATREPQYKDHLQAAQTAGGPSEDYTLALAELAQIPPDSAYAETASMLRSSVVHRLSLDEIAKAEELAKRGDCDAIAVQARELRAISAQASDHVLAVSCTPKRAGSGNAATASCDAADLLDKAREAGGANAWSQALKRAEASNACMPSASARQMALLAACTMGNETAAKKYWKEFENNGGMQQRCVHTMDLDQLATTPDPPTTQVPDPGECDAVALLNEARAAGGANQWSKVLVKAEASNKCVASKSARQLVLLAACNLGDKRRALKYWKEFENNTGMQQRCVSVIR
jgi:hypothetical protein